MTSDGAKRIFQLEVTRYLRDRMTWAGLLAFVIVLLAGAIDYWNALPPRPRGARLFGEAYLLALSVAFHAAIAHDRASRFDVFLVSNFVSVADVYFGKMLAALFFLAVFAVIAFVAGLAAALGDLGYAAHYTTLLFAASILLLPLVVMLEIAVAARYPVPLILLLVFILLAVYNRAGDLPRALRWFGLTGELNLGAAAVRTSVAVLFTAALYPLYRLRLGWRR